MRRVLVSLAVVCTFGCLLRGAVGAPRKGDGEPVDRRTPVEPSEPGEPPPEETPPTVPSTPTTPPDVEPPPSTNPTPIPVSPKICGKPGFEFECRYPELNMSPEELEIAPGSSATATLKGPGALQTRVSHLPPGVTASVSSIPGMVGARLTVTAQPTAAPFQGRIELRTNGVVRAYVVRVARALVFDMGGPGAVAPPLGLAPCAETRIRVHARLTAGQAGPVVFEATSSDGAPLPSGVSARFDPPQAAAPAGGDTAPSTLILTQTGSVAPFQLAVSASAGAARGGIKLNVLAGPGLLSEVAPRIGRPPELGGRGTTVTLRGCGFTPGSKVLFGTSTGEVAGEVDPAGKWMRVEVSRHAMSGPIIVKRPDGATFTSTQAFAVDTWRRRNGFPFGNTRNFTEATGGYVWSDLETAFGDNVNLSVFGWNSPVPDPMVLFTLGVAQAFRSTGNCVGFSDATLRIRNGQRTTDDFPWWTGDDRRLSLPPLSRNPNLAAQITKDVWHLGGPDLDVRIKNGPGGKDSYALVLSNYIHGRHLVQLGTEFIEHLSTYWPGTAENLKKDLLNAFNGGGAVLSMANSWPGHHTVYAYDVEDVPGGFDIHVYDPNKPYDLKEDTDDPTHRQYMDWGRVRIRGSCGSFDNGGSITWSGNVNDLTVFSKNDYPLHGTPIVSLAWGGLKTYKALHILIGSSVPKVVTTIAGCSTSSKPTAGPPTKTLNLGGGRGLTIAHSTGPLTFDLGGDVARGPRTAQYIGPGLAFDVETQDNPTGSEQVTIDPSTRLLKLRGGPRSTRVMVIGRPAQGKASRKATFTTPGGDAEVSFDSTSEEVRYKHAGGAGAVQVELETVSDDGKALRFRQRAVQMRSGDEVLLKPQWQALDRGAGTIRQRLRGVDTELKLEREP